MEAVEKEHIRNHVHDLVTFTNCNPILLSKLRSQFILSKGDVEELKQVYTTMGNIEAGTRMYALVSTKKGSYKALVEALKETGQTKACEILEKLNA